MRRLLLGTAMIVAFGAQPAKAVLQIAAQIGPDSFFCADNTACDTNPAVGVLQVNDTVIDGIEVNGSLQASTKAPGFNSLNTGSLSITNTSASSITLVVAVSDTDFLPVARRVNTAGSGVWQGPGGSTILMNWAVDAADAQGANTAFNVPGTTIDTFAQTAKAIADSFSHDGGVDLTLTSPFSMTEQATATLSAGESLVNRGQAEVTLAVPEPGTWVMTGLGFALLAGLGARARGRMALY